MSHKAAKKARKDGLYPRDDRGPWVDPKDCIKGRPMCQDCAFRKGSKEMLAYQTGVSEVGADDAPGVIVHVGSAIHKMLAEDGEPKPFYCHFHPDGSAVATDDHGRYQYDLDSDGKPRGVPVCAGWLAMVERFRRVMEADGDKPRREKRPQLEREARRSKVGA